MYTSRKFGELPSYINSVNPVTMLNIQTYKQQEKNDTSLTKGTPIRLTTDLAETMEVRRHGITYSECSKLNNK